LTTRDNNNAGGRELAGLFTAILTPMKVFHVTSKQAAAEIDRLGFRDSAGTFLTDQNFTGVFVSDEPLDVQSGMEQSVTYEIDLGDCDLSSMEWLEEGKPYREWLIPAAVLNRARRRRL
jgi:hypothetical protein